MIKKLFFSTTLFTFCAVAPLSACGPDFPESYFYDARTGLKIQSVFARELLFLLEENKDLTASWGKLKPSTVSTLEAEKSDFYCAIRSMNFTTAQSELINLYCLLAKDVRDGKTIETEQLEKLPEQFRLWLTAWIKLKAMEKNSPLPPQELITLADSPVKYPERALWARYLLGNFYFYRDPQKAIAYYEACRELGRKGYSDTPGLAFLTFDKQILLEKESAKRILLCFEQFYHRLKSGTNNPDLLRYLLAGADKKALLKNPLTREIYAARMMNAETLPQAEITEFLKETEGLTFRNGDRMAYIALQDGNRELAEAWLSKQEKKDILYYWLKLQFARIDGDKEKMLDCLRKWTDLLPSKQKERFTYVREHNMREDIYAYKGAVKIQEKDLTEALHCFLLAEAWLDAAHIAENFMTAEALKQYTDAQAKHLKLEHFLPYSTLDVSSKEISEAEKIGFLKNILARRMVREGSPEKASAYMCEQNAVYLKLYLEYLNEAEKATAKDQKALAWYNASKLMRFKGMEIAGTYSAPDFSLLFGGHFAYEYERKGMKPRFQYRYQAAELAERAARTAEDRSLKALILYAGGSYLMTDPAKADVFYKKLVTECRLLPLSDLCDRKKWFAEKFVSQALKKEITSIVPLTSVQNARKLIAESVVEKE